MAHQIQCATNQTIFTMLPLVWRTNGTIWSRTILPVIENSSRWLTKWHRTVCRTIAAKPNVIDDLTHRFAFLSCASARIFVSRLTFFAFFTCVRMENPEQQLLTLFAFLQNTLWVWTWLWTFGRLHDCMVTLSVLSLLLLWGRKDTILLGKSVFWMIKAMETFRLHTWFPSWWSWCSCRFERLSSNPRRNLSTRFTHNW